MVEEQKESIPTQDEAPVLRFETVIAGKRVWFKERLRRRENRDLMKLINESSDEARGDEHDDSKQMELLRRIIDRWEFDGEPSDPDAYEELDELSEIPALKAAVAVHITARFEASKERALKN